MPVILPNFIPPMLPEYAQQLPEEEQWATEIKFDGFRIQAQAFNGQVRIFTRQGADWTKRFKRVADELAKIKGRYVFDGELVVFNTDRTTSLRDVQNYTENAHRLVLVPFDLLYEGRRSLVHLPWEKRRERLEAVCPANDIIHPSIVIAGATDEILQNARAKNMEGLVFKKKNSLYVSGRTKDWQKVKCFLEQDTVVIGFTADNDEFVDSLLMGIYEKRKLQFVTAVSVGIPARDAKRLKEKLNPLVDESYHIKLPKSFEGAERVRWVKPELVAKVRYQSWPENSAMRSPVYMGLRYDIKPSAVHRDREIRLLAPHQRLG